MLCLCERKNHDILKNWDLQANLGTPRKIPDIFLNKGYQSNNKLQARHWKLALQDAVETWDKYWKAIFVQVRSKIFHCKSMTDEENKHSDVLHQSLIYNGKFLIEPEQIWLSNIYPKFQRHL